MLNQIAVDVITDPEEGSILLLLRVVYRVEEEDSRPHPFVFLNQGGIFFDPIQSALSVSVELYFVFPYRHQYGKD